MLYQIGDYFFTIFHLFIIIFTLLGWIWPGTRKIHFILICATLSCWFLLGIWFGIGYCPITDWQWQIKEILGERNLPASFIKYVVDHISGRNINADLVDFFTGMGFLFAIVAAVYVKYFLKRSIKVPF